MSFMLQLCLTLTGGAGLALQTGNHISKKTGEVTTLETPPFVGPAQCPPWVKSGHSSPVSPMAAFDPKRTLVGLACQGEIKITLPAPYRPSALGV